VLTVQEGPRSFRSDSSKKTCAKGKPRLNRKLLFAEISPSNGVSSNNSFLSEVLNQIFGSTNDPVLRTNSTKPTLYM